jgi:histidinol-phosphate aminotransferase
MDELLAMAIRTFVDPGDTILSVYPTYSLYEVLCDLHGAVFETVDLTDNYQIPEAMYSAEGRLIFLPRPNAPTGTCVPREAIERLCMSFDGIVIIDEAYVDFSTDNCMDFPKRFDNAIVMRTFSKSYSLAGMRLGVAVAHPGIIGEFLKTKDSYNMNAVAQAVGQAAIEDQNHFLANTEKVVATRERMSAALRDLGFSVPDSQANFVLAKWAGTPSACELFESLKAQNIFVRYFNARGLEDALRISVGTDAEVDDMLATLEKLVQ